MRESRGERESSREVATGAGGGGAGAGGGGEGGETGLPWQLMRQPSRAAILMQMNPTFVPRGRFFEVLLLLLLFHNLCSRSALPHTTVCGRALYKGGGRTYL